MPAVVLLFRDVEVDDHFLQCAAESRAAKQEFNMPPPVIVLTPTIPRYHIDLRETRETAIRSP
jgi:hypothetical protein